MVFRGSQRSETTVSFETASATADDERKVGSSTRQNFVARDLDFLIPDLQLQIGGDSFGNQLRQYEIVEKLVDANLS